MKKIIIFLSLALFLGGLIAICLNINPKTASAENSEVIRIHIRANSNSEADQAVKHKIKEATVEFLAPLIAESKDRDDLENKIKAILPKLEELADNILKINNFNYRSKVKFQKEEFPTRNYGEIRFEKGIYHAIIFELGDAVGDNWWCVVYPPLCFVGNEASETKAVEYRSKLIEIIRKFS